MTDEHEQTHDEGHADAVARAIRVWRENRTPAAQTALETLLHKQDTDAAPLEKLIEAMAPGPDGESEGGPPDIENERSRALKFLAENRPLEVLTPPEYPTSTEREWLLHHWLPRGRLTLFTGPGGKGKSRLALQLAASLASGALDWLGTQTTAPRIAGGEAPVVLATYEDEPEEAWRRLEAIQLAMGPRPPGGRFTLVDLAGYGALWGPPSDSRHPNAPAELTATGRELRALCERRGARLLIVDPLAGAFAANENDRTVVRSFIASWDKWGRENDCAVLLIAHPPKETATSGKRLYSGSTDWLGGPRSLLVLDSAQEKGTGTDEVPERTARFMRVEKSSYGPDGAVIWLTETQPAVGMPPVFGQSNEPDYREQGQGLHQASMPTPQPGENGQKQRTFRV